MKVNGKKIKEILLKKDLKQVELAKKIGMTNRAISFLLKTGKTKISTIQKIADALEVEPGLIIDIGAEDYSQFQKFQPELFINTKEGIRAVDIKHNISALHVEVTQARIMIRDKEKIIEMLEAKIAQLELALIESKKI